MATAAQVIANRANAQQSTGPRSPAGKAASAANAVTNGLTAMKLFVRPEEQAEFDSLESGLLAELQPEGFVESFLFDRILHASWNLLRCDALEHKLQEQAFAKGLDDATQDDELARQLDRIYRYKKTHDAARRRAMTDLRQIQTEQIRRRENQELMEESILVDTTAILKALSIKVAREDIALAKRVEANVRAFMEAPAPTPLK